MRSANGRYQAVNGSAQLWGGGQHEVYKVEVHGAAVEVATNVRAALQVEIRVDWIDPACAQACVLVG